MGWKASHQPNSSTPWPPNPQPSRTLSSIPQNLRQNPRGTARVQTDDFAQLPWLFVDQIQWRDEVIRPVILFADRTTRQRAHEPHTHPATVRRFAREFRPQ